MLFRSFVAPSVALLAAASQVSAHCFISPGLGVSGAGTRNDVRRPSAANPCGGANLGAISTSTAAQAVNGLFSATAKNFNAGQDGSTQIVSAKVDITGTGKSFTGTATVVKNGVKAPTTVGSVPIQIQLPAGTVCKGPGGKCLVSVTTAGGFGDCLVVSTGSGNKAKTSNRIAVNAAVAVPASSEPASSEPSVVVAAPPPATPSLVPVDAAAGTNTTDATGKKHHHHHHHHGAGANSTTAVIAAPAAETGALNAEIKQQVRRNREESRDALSLIRNVKRNMVAVRNVACPIIMCRHAVQNP